MIDPHTFVPLAFFRKEAYSGSHQGLRYLIRKEDQQLAAYTYPEPYCFDATPQEDKLRQTFDFTPEGRIQAIEWLNQQYETFLTSRLASPNR